MEIAEKYLTDTIDSKIFLRWDPDNTTNENFDIEDLDDNDEENDGPDDDEIMSVMRNRLPQKKRSAISSAKKMQLMEQIYDYGIRYTPETDQYFQQSKNITTT